MRLGPRGVASEALPRCSRGNAAVFNHYRSAVRSSRRDLTANVANTLLRWSYAPSDADETFAMNDVVTINQSVTFGCRAPDDVSELWDVRLIATPVGSVVTQ